MRELGRKRVKHMVSLDMARARVQAEVRTPLVVRTPRLVSRRRRARVQAGVRTPVKVRTPKLVSRKRIKRFWHTHGSNPKHLRCVIGLDRLICTCRNRPAGRIRTRKRAYDPQSMTIKISTKPKACWREKRNSAILLVPL